MKYFSLVTLVFVVMVGTAQAGISTSLVEITADSGHGDLSDNLADRAPGLFSYALMVTTTGPHVDDPNHHENQSAAAVASRRSIHLNGSKWLGTLLEVELTDGEVYYHSFGNVAGPPPENFIGLFPDLRYTTYFTNPDLDIGGGEVAGIVPNPIFRRGDPAVDINKMTEAQHLVHGMFEGDPGRGGAVSGTHMVGLLTFSNDAVGQITGISTDEDSAGSGIQFSLDIPIPEPSTLVLSALGLMGLGFIRTRRRRA